MIQKKFVFLVPGCDGAPLLPLLFIIVNIGFNIALLHLLKISSAVVSCLASTFSGMLVSQKYSYTDVDILFNDNYEISSYLLFLQCCACVCN